MASAARSASRAFLRSTPATSSFRPAARSARFALRAQGLSVSGRRGYASEVSDLNLESTVKAAFVPTKDDYQEVYDAIAQKMANETDYDDGSYGPVSWPLTLSVQLNGLRTTHEASN